MVLRNLRHPVVQAPLAGGPATPALAAAVSEAGGLGFVAAGYRSADALRSDIAAVRARTSAPFGVNVFVPSADSAAAEAVAAFARRLGPEARRYGIDLGDPRDDDDDWDAKLRVVADERPSVVSFTFGCPPEAEIAALRDRGSEVWVTVTSLAEARVARRAGADALVLQGSEAGGHRGSFTDDGSEGLGVLVLLRLAAREIDLPLVAAGGIADGAALAAAIVAGAAAAQVGTAFMRASEAGTHRAHCEALASETETALTRAFTGRSARGLRNRFLVEHSEAAPAAYPQIHHLTAPLRAAARERDDSDGFNLWAGQAHALARDGSAAQIVAALATEARVALEAALPRLRGL